MTTKSEDEGTTAPVPTRTSGTFIVTDPDGLTTPDGQVHAYGDEIDADASGIAFNVSSLVAADAIAPAE